jgi:hypothetical protein
MKLCSKCRRFRDEKLMIEDTCYYCMPADDPRIIRKELLRECERCHKHLRASHVPKHRIEHLYLCPSCTAKVDETNAKSNASFTKRTARSNGAIDRRLATERERNKELQKEHTELLRRLRISQPLIPRDQTQSEAHTRNEAFAKVLRADSGRSSLDALYDAQHRRKRAEGNARQSRLPRPVPYGSLGALADGQKNSRKADGLSRPAPGDATAGAEQVAVTDRSMPRSYEGVPSGRDDSFLSSLPGGPATSNPVYDYYPDSANLHPDWAPEGSASPITVADAAQRDTYSGNLGIRLFNGDSSAFFTPASATDRFVGSSVVIRTPNRAANTDLGKLAASLAMKLKRGPKVFGRNI